MSRTLQEIKRECSEMKALLEVQSERASEEPACFDDYGGGFEGHSPDC